MRRLILACLAAFLPVPLASAQIVVTGGIGVSFRGRHVHAQASCRPAPVCPPVPCRTGYWKTVCDRVWVEPCYEWRRDACGRYYKACVRPGYWTRVERRVWVAR